MQMHIRSLLFIPIASVAIYSCSHDEDTAGPPSGYEDVQLQGAVTDETLVAFSEALAQRGTADVASQKAVFTWPGNGEVVPKSPPKEFWWQIGVTTERADAEPAVRWAGLEALKPHAPATPKPIASPLRELLGAPRQAFAHGDPYNGTGTFLVFSTDTNPKLLRVFTSDLKFTPSQEAWNAMVAVGKPITATLTTAIFEQNRIGPDDGPFVGASIQFTIAP